MEESGRTSERRWRSVGSVSAREPLVAEPQIRALCRQLHMDAVSSPVIGTWAHGRRALLLMATCCLLTGEVEGRMCGTWGCACACRGMPPARRGARFEQLRLRGGGVNSVYGRYLHGGGDR